MDRARALKSAHGRNRPCGLVFKVAIHSPQTCEYMLIRCYLLLSTAAYYLQVLPLLSIILTLLDGTEPNNHLVSRCLLRFVSPLRLRSLSCLILSWFVLTEPSSQFACCPVSACWMFSSFIQNSRHLLAGRLRAWWRPHRYTYSCRVGHLDWGSFAVRSLSRGYVRHCTSVKSLREQYSLAFYRPSRLHGGSFFVKVTC